ncbi:ATP-binding protein [Parabacteroides sp. PF5-6]|uniref:AlbA family DNA-binding domain-containing protein n=1 Tax=Parabacteroides sp. PF5-6 TaxID=1742403 RepID=UPI0024072B30|nr:ATP-binding protein [Parabacteroides sp. PF5-6]MDF9829833.1 putative HTH transcriptional regulator [Parabacteroides sp. PF5-6]
MKKKHPIEELISQGEHQQLDFKFEVSDSKKIARTLSAFANTDGGRLLIGVKDNGVIAGVRSEEEYYMIEAASTMYTRPPVPFEAKRWDIQGKTVLEVYIAPSPDKPHAAPDKDDKYKAYIRVNDENILANEILIFSWQKEQESKGILLKINKPVERLFDWLDTHTYINANQFCRIGRINYFTARNILSDLMAIGALQYAVVDKRILYCRRTP